jgi:mono/diheme cytochrome c family protein
MRRKRLIPLAIVLATLGVVVGCFAQSALKSTAAARSPVDEGRGLFQSECVTCHGDKGDRIPVAPLNSRDFLDSRGDATLTAVIGEGKGVMPAWGTARGGPLSDDQVRAVVAYLSSAADRASPIVLASAGQAIYQDECTTCHGQKGDRVPVAPLNIKAFLDSRTDAQLTDVVAHGTGVMPPFGKRPGVAAGLSDDQVKAVVAYLRTNVDAGIAASVARGRSLYLSDCLSCHGEKGDRVPNVLLASPDYLRKEGDVRLAQVVVDGKGSMPGLLRARTAGFDVQDLTALQTYLKTWAGLPAGVALTGGSGTQVAAAAATAPATAGAMAAATAPVIAPVVAAAPAPAAAAAPAKDVAQGKDIFGQKCVSCHGAKGDQMGAVKLMDSGFLQQRGDQALQQTISTGKGGMPAMGKDKGGTLTGDDIAAVLAFLKSQAGAPAPAAAPASAGAAAPAPAAAAPFTAAPATSAASAPLTPDEQALVSHGKSLFSTNCSSCHGESKDQLGKLGNGTWLLQRGDRAIIQTISDGRSVPGAPLAMPAFSSTLSADDIGSLLAYLKSVAGISLTAAPVAAGPDPAHGKEVFGSTCAACHGPRGDQLPTAKLNDASFLQQRGEVGLTQIVTSGKGGMPAFSGKLSADDIGSVVAFLQSQAGIAPGAAPADSSTPAAAAAPAPAASAPAPAASAPALAPGGGSAKGKDVFTANCTSCHGARGDQMPTAKLSDAAFLKQRGDQALTQSIASGKGGMPAWSGKLSADDISAVLAYIRSLAGLDSSGSDSATAATAPEPAAKPDPAATDSTQPVVDVNPEVGHELFVKNCSMCHGEDGTRIARVQLLSPDFGGRISTSLLNTKISRGASAGGMPTFSKARGGPLSESQIAAIVAYIKDAAGGTP